ncbi:slipin family protein [Streptomyces sp. LUP30]|uniref:slipin family protein n=1 Tax=Streptomyces sp. LUP30 TaxID=1890285 RepID=UPI00099F5B21|nr:SPFH domain-containing protein [Streptomyces sp. LUP30]
MLQELLGAAAAVAAGAAVYLGAAARVVKQYERGVVLRLGRLHGDVRAPGLTLVIPAVDRLRKVNLQIVTMPIPGQEGITRDNVTVRVDAVVYFRVVDAAAAIINVEDYRFAVSQMAQTSLRSIIGKSELDDLLSNREKLNEGLELMIDSPAVGWGVQIDRVEIKDVSLPDTMKRSMARQAEADRERRARIINADAELQASKKLAEAAKEMSEQPAALQLRLLQTVVAVAAEKNSTLVLPFPVELLRFLEKAQQPGQPMQPAQPMQQPPQPIQQAQPAQSMQQGQPSQQVPSVQQAEPAQPVQPPQAVQAQPAEGLQQAQPVQQARPAQAVQQAPPAQAVPQEPPGLVGEAVPQMPGLVKEAVPQQTPGPVPEAGAERGPGGAPVQQVPVADLGAEGAAGQ